MTRTQPSQRVDRDGAPPPDRLPRLLARHGPVIADALEIWTEDGDLAVIVDQSGGADARARVNHYSVWRDGWRWRYEVSTGSAVRTGWRPTLRSAIRRAHRQVHPSERCPACAKPTAREARRCSYCNAVIRSAPGGRRR